MRKDLVTVRVDPETKKEAEELFKDLGITMSGAINMFLKTAIREGGIPFDIARTKTVGRKIKPLRKK